MGGVVIRNKRIASAYVATIPKLDTRWWCSSIATSWWRKIRAGGIIVGLRVATHISVGISARPVPLHNIRREEHACYLVIIARPIVIQPGQTIGVLPGKALGGVAA